MAKHTSLTLAAALLATTFAAASAQTTQNHEAHHPAGAEATTDATAPQAGSQAGMAAPDQKGGGMMGNGMMGDGMMGAMMGAMMGGQAGSPMAPFAHTEGRIAFLKAELAITDAQAPQWNAFADALRGASKSMHESMTSMMQAGMPSNAADRTDAMVKMMAARLDSLKTIASAEKALYAVLTDAQKKTADELLSDPMGMGPMMSGPMMGAGGPTGPDVKPKQ
jgi:hypothetical protein